VDIRNSLKILSFNTFIPYFYPALMLSIKHWRIKAIGMLNFNPKDRILIPGIGSGHDLPLLPRDVMVEGVDISEVMLGIARAKLKVYRLEKTVHLSITDAERLPFPDQSFDKAILSLFLTCVYDPRKAFAEVVRVLKPGGEILIYDHLIRKKKWSKTILGPLDAAMKFNFCSIVRTVEDCIEGQPVSITKVIPGDPLGFVKGFLLKKNEVAAKADGANSLPNLFKRIFNHGKQKNV
jgi:SAM-dependent methyltransferase